MKLYSILNNVFLYFLVLYFFIFFYLFVKFSYKSLNKSLYLFLVTKILQ